MSGGDLSLVNIGGEFRSLDYFDRIYVGPGVILQSAGDIYVRNGSIDDPSTTSLKTRGLVLAHSTSPSFYDPPVNLSGSFALPSAYTITGDVSWNGVKINGSTLNAGNITLSNGILRLTGTLNAGNLSITNSTLNVPTVNLTGDLTLGSLSSTITTLTADKVFVNAGSHNITTTNANAYTLNGGAVSSQTLNIIGPLQITGGTLLHPGTTATTVYRLNANVGSLMMTGGSINVSGYGYTGNGVQWAANNTIASTLGSSMYGGGNHGGIGGGGFTVNSTGRAYDNYRNPNFPGGAGTWTTNANGGGVVRITSSGLCQIDNGATIWANGTTESTGGAGGSIYMNCSGFAGSAGAGAISASGGAATNVVSNNGFGGGGGGMIAMISTGNASSFSGNFSYPVGGGIGVFLNTVRAIGGVGKSSTTNGGAGSAGTIYVQNSDNAVYGGDLLIYNGATASWTSPYNTTKTTLPSFTGTVVNTTASSVTITATSSPALSSSFDGILLGRTVRPDITYDNGTPNDFSDDNILNVTGNTSTTVNVSGGDTALISPSATFRSVEVLDHIYIGTGSTFETKGDLYLRNGSLNNPSSSVLNIGGTVTVGGALYPPTP